MAIGFGDFAAAQQAFYVFGETMYELHLGWVQEQTPMYVLEDPTRSLPEEVGTFTSIFTRNYD